MKSLEKSEEIHCIECRVQKWVRQNCSPWGAGSATHLGGRNFQRKAEQSSVLPNGFGIVALSQPGLSPQGALGGTLSPLSQLREDIPQQKATGKEAFPSDPSGATPGVTFAPPRSLPRFPVCPYTPHSHSQTIFPYWLHSRCPRAESQPSLVPLFELWHSNTTTAQGREGQSKPWACLSSVCAPIPHTPFMFLLVQWGYSGSSGVFSG